MSGSAEFRVLAAIHTACWNGPIPIWEFPKVRGTLFGGPYNKDPTI